MLKAVHADGTCIENVCVSGHVQEIEGAVEVGIGKEVTAVIEKRGLNYPNPLLCRFNISFSSEKCKALVKFSEFLCNVRFEDDLFEIEFIYTMAIHQIF